MYLYVWLPQKQGPCKQFAIWMGGACVKIWISNMLYGIRHCCLVASLIKPEKLPTRSQQSQTPTIYFLAAFLYKHATVNLMNTFL